MIGYIQLYVANQGLHLHQQVIHSLIMQPITAMTASSIHCVISRNDQPITPKHTMTSPGGWRGG